MSGPGLLHKLTPSMEYMAYQGDKFFLEIAKTISHYRELGIGKGQIKNLEKDLTDLIKKRTGMNIKVSVPDVPMFNAVSAITPVHLKQVFDNYVTDVTLSESKTKNVRRAVMGSVNTKTGTVSGIFSKLETNIYIFSPVMFHNYMTPEESAATVLHEVGHVFTTMLLSASYLHGCQHYADVVRQYEGSSTYGERGVILKRAINDMSDSKISKDEIEAALKADGGSKEALGTLSLIMRVCQDDFDKEAGPSLEYTGRVLEQMADEYEQKNGAGVHSATGLDKMMSSNPEYRSGAMGAFSRAPAIFFPVLLVMGSFAVPSLAIAAVLYFAITTMMNYDTAKEGSATYDTPKARFSKITNQLAIRAKDSSLPKDVAEKLTEEYKIAKMIEDKYSDAPKWFVQVFETLIPPFKRRARFTAAMVELERLASSELYVQSQRLKHA